MKRRVLVTGSSGFLAGHLAAAMRGRGWADELRGVDSIPRGALPFETAADIADAEAVEALLSSFPPDIVFHLGSPPPSSPIDELRRVNVAGTRALLAALARLDPQPRVLVAGSAAEYGSVAAGESPVHERTPLRPRGPYGISKAEQTSLCLDEARRTGLPVIVFRPFNVIGPGMPAHLAFGNFARQIAAAEESPGAAAVRVGRLDGVRDFIDARDVAKALLLLAESGRSGGIYNICTGEPHSVREGLEILLGFSAARIPLVEQIGPPAGAEPPGFTGDPSMLRRETGWRASIPFRDSLCDLLEAERRMLRRAARGGR